MKKKIAVYLTLFVTLLSPIAAQSSRPATELNVEVDLDNGITIEEAVVQALAANLSYANSIIELQSAGRNLTNSWNNFLPSIALSTGLTYQDRLLSTEPTVEPVVIPAIPGVLDEPINLSGGGGSADPLTLNVSLSAALQLNLATIDNIAISRIEYQAGEISLQQAERQLTANVKKAFYSLLAMESNIALLEANLATASEQYEQSLIRYGSGYLSELDMLQSQVAYEVLKPSLADAKTGYQLQKENFLSLIGLPVTSELELIGELDIPADLMSDNYSADVVADSRENDIDFSISERSDFAALNNSIALLTAQRNALSNGSRLPTLSLNGNWSSPINEPFNGDSYSEGNWYDSLTLSVGLSIPLDGWIPGSSADSRIKELDGQIEILQNQLALLGDAATIEIRNLRQQLLTTRQNIAAQTINVELAGRSYAAAGEGYRQGTVDQLTVQSSRNQLLQVRQQLLAQKLNLLTGLIDLDYALGK